MLLYNFYFEFFFCVFIISKYVNIQHIDVQKTLRNKNMSAWLLHKNIQMKSKQLPELLHYNMLKI